MQPRVMMDVVPPAGVGWPRAALPSAGVDVWSERVDGDADLDQAQADLDEDERRRAGRFLFERDRRRFAGRRAFLRRVLAGYLGIDPAAIRYRTTALGRPELRPACGITFSTSHADGLAVVAVARERPVGIDLERVRPVPDALDIAHGLFTRREYEDLESLPAAARSEGFLRLWTRKEAYVKAIGAGMSMPFHGFDVLDGDVRRSQGKTAGRPGRSWALKPIEGLAGYVGAVAAWAPGGAVDVAHRGAGPS